MKHTIEKEGPRDRRSPSERPTQRYSPPPKRLAGSIRLILILTCALGPISSVLAQSAPSTAIATAEKEDRSEPAWAQAMRDVHARFRGTPGYFAQYGDSITDSRAFWSSLKYKRDQAPAEMADAFDRVDHHMLEKCWDLKGPEYGNQSGRTIRWAREHLPTWLDDHNPEVAVVMFGTNDLNSVPLDEYSRLLNEFVSLCLDNGTVVLLTTIPPRNRFEKKSAKFAEAIRNIAREHQLPLIDYQAEILKRRPNDWNGALDRFGTYEGYDVPTLIARDGVHPSAPKAFRGIFTDESLHKNGFALRNYLTLLTYSDVIEHVVSPGVRPASD